MIKRLTYKLLVLATLFSTSSCNKWLDLKPEDGIIKDNYWKTKEQLEAAVVGCYSSLLDAPVTTSLFEWGELRADMVSPGPNASIDEVNMAEGNILPTNSITSWAAIYETINYCNTVIEFAPSVQSSDKTLTTLQLNSYLAEARGLRALMYFYLLRTFGEVPLQLEAVSSDTRIKQLPKSSQEQVYDQIVADLKFAEQNSPLTYGNRITDKGRLTRYAIYALQADVYLWMNDYQNCIDACDKIINSNQFALVKAESVQDQSTWFNTVFRFGNSQESIFEFQFDNQKMNPFYGLFISPTHFVPSLRVQDEVFGVDEVNPLENMDIRGDNASFAASVGKIAKFYSGRNFESTSSSLALNHWFVYRYADILLLKAEALAWSDRGQEALDLIQKIRERAHAIQFTDEFPSADDPEAITLYILNERAREFAFEGKRWFDVLRVAKRNNYELLSVMIDIVAAVAPADRQQSIINKYKDVRSHYLPINQYEIQTDKALVQNPFYQ